MSEISAMADERTLPATAPDKRLKGWHVLLIMLGFFGVVFAVNGVFLYNAIKSFPGEDVKKSYVQGINYNQTLAARAAQAELGWNAQAGWAEDGVVFRLSDSNGEALSGYPVIGELRRVADDFADQALVFSPRLNGEYVSKLDSLASGRWQLRVTVLDWASDAPVFTAEKTLLVP
ncbi:MAG: FixH family protein [Pseudomonadota bacterium]